MKTQRFKAKQLTGNGNITWCVFQQRNCKTMKWQEVQFTEGNIIVFM